MPENKKCQECSQELQKDCHYSYYSVILKGKNTNFCPTCWESKKNDLKEQLKQAKLSLIQRQYKSAGNNKEIDKNSEEVIQIISAYKTTGDRLGNLATEFKICFGCDEWNETEKEHGESCQEAIAEKRELETLRENLRMWGSDAPINQQNKSRLEELEKKYSNLNSDNQESRIKNQESRIKNQESRIKNQESRIKNQESRIKNQSAISPNTQDSQSKPNYLPWILGGIGIVSLVGGLAWYFTRNKEK